MQRTWPTQLGISLAVQRFPVRHSRPLLFGVSSIQHGPPMDKAEEIERRRPDRKRTTCQLSNNADHSTARVAEGHPTALCTRLHCSSEAGKLNQSTPQSHGNGPPPRGRRDVRRAMVLCFRLWGKFRCTVGMTTSEVERMRNAVRSRISGPSTSG